MNDSDPLIPAPFVVGVGRSGTTMLRLMLDAHPELTIPPETHFLPDLIAAFDTAEATPETIHDRLVEDRRWSDFHLDSAALLGRLEAVEPFEVGPALRTLYELYAEKEGKPRWGDKTPNYVDRMGEIEKVLPEARFIHLIRDGRDVAMSRIKRSLKNPPPMQRVARNWKRRIRRAQNSGSKLNHYLELRYEDLVLDTEGTLRTICDFIELPFDDCMLTYYERAEQRMSEMAGDLKPVDGKPMRPGDERMAAHALTREPPSADAIGRWRKRMDAADLETFERVAGDLLAELDYEVTVPSRKPSKLKAALAGPTDRARSAVGRIGALRRRAPATAEAINPDTSRAPAPFVVGVTRSGTTLLRLMLDAHPLLAIPPETHFVPDLVEVFQDADSPTVDDTLAAIEGNRRWGDFHVDAAELRGRLEQIEPLNVSDSLRAFYELYAEKQGKERWGDKTPIYINRMLLIQRALPEARFIHLIRDGRDAALSRAKRVLTDPTPIPKVAERWKNRILRAREQADRLPYYLELHYEDLIRDTEATLRTICEFIDLPFDEAMLTYYEGAEERMAEMARDLPSEGDKPLRPADHRVEAHKLTQKPPDPSRLGRWRENMSEQDQEAFEGVAGDLLEELGYEVTGKQIAGTR
ncbi:MAG: sulfotransferase family protein [Solirubrobacterales bacterium]